MACLNLSYNIKFFKGCLPQNFLNPYLNTLSNMFILGNYICDAGQKAPNLKLNILKFNKLKVRTHQKSLVVACFTYFFFFFCNTFKSVDIVQE